MILIPRHHILLLLYIIFVPTGSAGVNIVNIQNNYCRERGTCGIKSKEKYNKYVSVTLGI